MGASDGEEGGGIGDCSVGTIVWVRRRNGSWWPGRILGQHELSASHLMSPRSGTPVKLLGREDASVDWYNLEKSKRVKAFRCGEFDACIERAEASQGIPIKKREKYARREDAILHALELEKQILEKQQQKLGGSSNKYSGASKKELSSGFQSASYLRNDESAGHGKFVNSKSQLLSRGVDPSFSEGSMNPYTQKGKGGRYSNWEDDNSDAMPRMRGLQDFDLPSAQSKRKGIEVENNVKSRKSCPPFKKKRTQGAISEDFLGKKRDRRRPLVQVLQSSAKLLASQPLPSNYSSIPDTLQGECDQTDVLFRSKRSMEDYLPDDSNDGLDHTGYSSDHMQISPTLFDYPGPLGEENTSSGLIEADETSSERVDSDTEDDETLLPDISQSLNPYSRNSGGYVEDDSPRFAVRGKYGSNSNEDALLSEYMSPLYPHEQMIGTSVDAGVSKWNMKGKRNIRNLTRKPMMVMDEKYGNNFHSSMNGASYESKRHSFKSKGRHTGQVFFSKNVDFDEGDFIEKDLDPRYGIRRHLLTFKGASRDLRGGINDSDEDSLGMSPSGWEDDGLPQAARMSYWEDQVGHFDPFFADHLSDGMDSMFVDVNLKVQASYQGERVPLVSLMSRLNGKAIVGHPVHIEILDDGSTNALFSRSDSGEDPMGADGNTTPPPVWRTGRRTAMQRVPRPHPMPSALEGKEAGSLLYSEPQLRPTFKKPSIAAHFDQQARITKKSSHKKSSKKASLSNKKTRTLSSIATEHKHGNARTVDGKLPKRDRSILNGLIKPGETVPMVTCVPVKVVFSRILEAVGRSSSSVTHRGPSTGIVQRKSS